MDVTATEKLREAVTNVFKDGLVEEDASNKISRPGFSVYELRYSNSFIWSMPDHIQVRSRIRNYFRRVIFFGSVCQIHARSLSNKKNI